MARDEVKPLLSGMPNSERQALAEAVLQEQALRDPAYVAERLRRVVEQLAAEGVFDGMGEAEVHALLREAILDLGFSPSHGAQ